MIKDIEYAKLLVDAGIVDKDDKLGEELKEV